MSASYVSRDLNRKERFKQKLTWAYWRQTRLLYPITMWWMNR